jgi:hypothetical protein
MVKKIKISMDQFNYQKTSALDSLLNKLLTQFMDLLDHQRSTQKILHQLNNLNLSKEIPQSQFTRMTRLSPIHLTALKLLRN